MAHLIEADFQNILRNRDNFIFRDAQLEIAKNIYDFIETKKQSSLVIEAGTGTGKSLAYLMPIIRSGQTAIVSTNTKALQKQLAGELRFLQKLYPTTKFKILQGASNYACLLKAEGLGLPAVKNWLKDQFSNNGEGMIDDFKKDTKQFKKAVWDLIATDPSLCQESCRFYSECFYQSAKTDARSSSIIIVNHDLLLRGYKIQNDIYTMAKIVVIDEAHQFPDKARNALSHKFSEATLSKHIQLLNWKQRNIHHSNLEFDVETYQRLEEEIFNFFPEEAQITRFKEIHKDLRKVVQDTRRQLLEDMEQLSDKMGKDKKVFEEIAQDLLKIFLNEDENWIKMYTAKKTETKLERSFESIPIDVAPLLANMFTDKSVVLTSATLRSGKSFDFFKKQIGQEIAVTTTYPSPFDKNNVAVYIPKDIIDPGHPTYHQTLTNHMVQIHKKMRGRSMFLFTNREDLDSCRQLLPEELKTQFYFQTHTAEIPHMIKTLRSNDNISLAGLSALWEGIDVAGKALSCVCVMRMPFTNPEDILSNAIKDKFKKENPSRNDYEFFDVFELPQMLLKLKQGFGRLIRHETDTGIIALLDNRFLKRKYKNKIIELLEEYECFNDLNEAFDNIPHIDPRFSKIAATIK